VRTILAAVSAPDSKNALARKIDPAYRVASTTPMNMGKTRANSTAGEPTSSPASFRAERLMPAKNLPIESILATNPFLIEESCARRPYFSLIRDVEF
jgi:hypothetical protein